MQMLEGVCLNDNMDQIRWVHEKSGQYSTRLMNRVKLHRGVVNTQMRRVWSSSLLPMKLKVFLWLAAQDRLQIGVELKKKGWKDNARCSLCGNSETMDHIFFGCVLA